MLGIPKHAFNYFIHNAGHKHNIPNLDQEIGGRGTESGGERKVSTIELGNQHRLSSVRESDETEGIGQGAGCQPERETRQMQCRPTNHKTIIRYFLER